MRKMAFIAPLRASFVKPFPSQVSAATSWWLSGGIAAANCVAAYAPKGAASLAASYSNLNNPGTNNAAPGTAPTWDATNGWKFAEASNQYLTTGIVPANGWSMIARFSNGSGIGVAVGSLFTLRFFLRPNNAASAFAYGQQGVLNVAPVATSGVHAIANQTAYRNGSSDGSISTSSGTYAAITIGCRNNNGSLDLYWTGYVQALAIYNTDISSQVSALTTAISAL